MQPSTKLSPLFFFLSLGVLISLITSVSAFLSLSFATLDQAFPDILTASYQQGYSSYAYDGIRQSMAILIIMLPVFLVVTRYWRKAMHGVIGHFDEVVRRWAIYLVLFLATSTIVVDLVTLVKYFVSGEITVRFILKVALTLVVAGLAGWYFIRELKRDAAVVDTCARWFTLVSLMLAFGMIVWSFWVIGSPMNQRKLRLDQRRLEDLQSLQWQIINYWQQKQELPANLAVLNNPISSYAVPRDPEFQKGIVYEYNKVGDKTFKLCATFALPMPEGWVEQSRGYGGTMMNDVAVSSMPHPGGASGDSWDHEAGRACYDRTIDPDLYPPFPKPFAN